MLREGVSFCISFALALLAGKGLSPLPQFEPVRSASSLSTPHPSGNPVFRNAFLMRLHRWETVPSAGPHRLPRWWTDDASASSRASLPAFGPPPSARASAYRFAAERAEAS